jgi:hypothetical protein
MSFFTLMLMTSALAPQIQSVYAGGKSPFESGYDHGCDDADISDPDDQYINQPEKGPSFHTDEFMDGFYDGFQECGGGSSDDGNGDGNGGGSLEDNIRDDCVSLLGFSEERCDSLIQAGKSFVICNLPRSAGFPLC